MDLTTIENEVRYYAGERTAKHILPADVRQKVNDIMKDMALRLPISLIPELKDINTDEKAGTASVWTLPTDFFDIISWESNGVHGKITDPKNVASIDGTNPIAQPDWDLNEVGIIIEDGKIKAFADNYPPSTTPDPLWDISLRYIKRPPELTSGDPIFGAHLHPMIVVGAAWKVLSKPGLILEGDSGNPMVYRKEYEFLMEKYNEIYGDRNKAKPPVPPATVSPVPAPGIA